MQAWELAAAKTSSLLSRSPETHDQWLELMRTSWRPNFEKYCTSRKRVTGEYRHIQTPFYYDPRFESIVEMTSTSPNRVVVKTQSVQKVKGKLLPTGEQYYVLYKRKDKWLIDNRYFYSLNKIVRGTL
jgi:hypothetical protein